MKKRQGGYLLVEAAAALLVLLLGLAMFGAALAAASNAQRRRREQLDRVNTQLERYYAAEVDEGEPRTLALQGPDFAAGVPVRQHRWAGEGLTVYDFSPGSAP